jgi:predicted HAD superfamily hydrolase
MVKNVLLDEINKYDSVSFDVFGTLLQRLVKKDTDVFNLVDIKWQDEHNESIDFHKKRIKAEKIARKNNGITEVNIDEIYLEMHRFFSEEQCEELKKNEIEIEIQQVQKTSLYDAYRYCVENKKNIYIISDMYLPKSVIEQMLNNNGYTEYKKIYVSNEYRKTKYRNGELFLEVLKDNNIDKGKLIHIGDNKVADYEMPQKQGIRAFWIKLNNDTRLSYFRYGNMNENDRKLYDCLEKRIALLIDESNTNREYKLGFEVFGPLLYECACQMIDFVKLEGIKKVMFFSRDGYILEKAFAILAPELQRNYVYLSRRTVVPTLYYTDENVGNMLSRYVHSPKKCTISSLLDRLCLVPNNYRNSLNRLGLTLDTEVNYDSLYKNKNIKELFSSIEVDVRKNSLKLANKFKKYLDQEKFVGKIAIVDSGGGCTIERALKDFCRKEKVDVEIIPLYIETNNTMKRKGFSFIDLEKQKDDYICIRSIYYVLYELFFSAPHGSAIGYKEDGMIIKPICEKYKYEKDSIYEHDGEMIFHLREGALDFVRKYHKETKGKSRLKTNIAMQNVINFGCFPSKDDANKWGDVSFDMDGFQKLAPLNKRIKYFLRPYELLNDMKHSLWRTAFFSRLFGMNKFNYIYIMIYKMLKKNRG